MSEKSRYLQSIGELHPIVRVRISEKPEKPSVVKPEAQTLAAAIVLVAINRTRELYAERETPLSVADERYLVGIGDSAWSRLTPNTQTILSLPVTDHLEKK